MKKILLSLVTIGAVAALAIGASRAFFSDTETSIGNTFVAGTIDLQLDNTSYAIDWNIPGYASPNGTLVASTNTSWGLKDLTVEKFFDFVDLKPGDYGEDTISVHVNNNDAWVCAAARLTADNDNTYTEPERADDFTIGTDPATTDGELDNKVSFAFWNDDGDNVYETGETIFLQGPLSSLGTSGKIALADSTGVGQPLAKGSTMHIGKYWCFGDLTPKTVAAGSGDPTTRGTGFTCSGASVDNAAQTDKVVGDLQFYAVQQRNNPGFTCDSWTPSWVTRYYSNVQSYGPTGWAGWSCPTGKTAVGGGVIENTYPMGAEGIARPGATIGGFTYPVFPHYTFPGGETGYVAQNGGTGQTARIYVDCQQ